jgi:lipopolysaccharide/colanic/teichoic acid biosynthesis glycosyltransferase
VELDAWYLQHRSLALDLRIIALTARKVLGAHGVAH